MACANISLPVPLSPSKPAAAGRNASQSGSLRAAHGVSNHATLTGDVLKPRDVLRTFRRQML